MNSSDSFRIRPYQPEDRAAVYRVCLKTGDSGQDASSLYEDPELLGHIYVGPYITLEPELAFVLEDDLGVCGYVLGALDTKEFRQAFVTEWLPPLRELYEEPRGDPESWTRDQKLIYQLHHSAPDFPEDLHSYPAHLHIDLLVRAQSQGFGRRMMETLLAALVTKEAPGVHLGVGSANLRAQAFYDRLGFKELQRASGNTSATVFMGRRLP